MLGALEITALYDGYVDLDASLLLGANKAKVQRLLASKFLAGDKVQTMSSSVDDSQMLRTSTTSGT